MQREYSYSLRHARMVYGDWNHTNILVDLLQLNMVIAYTLITNSC